MAALHPQKKSFEIGKTKRGKDSKWMVVVDGEGIPLGGTITSASPAEVKLLYPLLDVTYKNTKIHRLVYDQAADSDPLRDSLLSRGIDLICPHRRNRKKPSRPDGRKLKRYARRWKVERTFAWLGNYRRLVIRWERYLSTYRAFFYIACMLITLKKL
ncbi:IS5 family transposase [Microbulbifer sp. SSSA007]|uniref:IS5 family transposase n=1 Tax=Microbulbifer sp. SSSA007 TaxID=3243379 RepID=UPI0040395303